MSKCFVQHSTAGFTVRNITTWLSKHSNGPLMGKPISLLIDLSHTTCCLVLTSSICSASPTKSPLPPAPSTKMHAHASVLQGSIYKLFFHLTTVYLPMIYSSKSTRPLKYLCVILTAMCWSNYFNHCLYHHPGIK